MENFNGLDLVIGSLALIIVISGLIMLFKGISVFNDQNK